MHMNPVTSTDTIELFALGAYFIFSVLQKVRRGGTIAGETLERFGDQMLRLLSVNLGFMSIFFRLAQWCGG